MQVLKLEISVLYDQYYFASIVEGREHVPIEVTNLRFFLFYRYKLLSRAKDKNLYRLPYWTRTCSYCRLGLYLIVIFPFNSLNLRQVSLSSCEVSRIISRANFFMAYVTRELPRRSQSTDRVFTANPSLCL